MPRLRGRGLVGNQSERSAEKMGNAIILDTVRIDPPVLLAPMAGITDRPFREMVASFGAGLVVSEMIASEEILTSNPTAQAKAEVAAGVVGTSIQIAGRDATWMAEAARMLAGQGAQIIDINMGCPAKRVTTGASGSALMREPDRALELIDAVVNAVDVPVTLKMRLGWDDALMNAPQIARSAEQAGIQMITVHGRTRCQFYRGDADWTAIGQTVQAVDIPVVANGDIVDGETAKAALAASGAAGVMVGRGAIGRPWLIAEIASALQGKIVDLRPRGQEFARLVADHARAHLEFYGNRIGIRAMRKHLDAYLELVPGTKDLRARLLRETDPDALFTDIAELGERDNLADQHIGMAA